LFLIYFLVISFILFLFSLCRNYGSRFISFCITDYLIIYGSKQKQNMKKGGVWGTAGAVLGFLGIGCSVCGTLVIAPLLALVGLGSILTVLPLQGGELGILALAILSIANYMLIKKLNNPFVCST